MKILAFDQATKICGWSYLIDGDLIDFGVHKPFDNLSAKEYKKVSINDRIYDVAEFVNSMIDKAKPDMVVFEDVQNQSNDKTLINLSKLLGILEYTVNKIGVKHSVVSPSSWRAHFGFGKSVNGVKPKREDLKRLAIKYVLDNYKTECSEDECEAILIGVAAHNVAQ